VVNVRNFINNVEAAGCFMENELYKFEGETFVVFRSFVKNYRVFINITDEEISLDTAVGYLWDLEMGDKVQSFFP